MFSGVPWLVNTWICSENDDRPKFHTKKAWKFWDQDPPRPHSLSFYIWFFLNCILYNKTCHLIKYFTGFCESFWWNIQLEYVEEKPEFVVNQMYGWPEETLILPWNFFLFFCPGICNQGGLEEDWALNQ